MSRIRLSYSRRFSRAVSRSKTLFIICVSLQGRCQRFCPRLSEFIAVLCSSGFTPSRSAVTISRLYHGPEDRKTCSTHSSSTAVPVTRQEAHGISFWSVAVFFCGQSVAVAFPHHRLVGGDSERRGKRSDLVFYTQFGRGSACQSTKDISRGLS